MLKKYLYFLFLLVLFYEDAWAEITWNGYGTLGLGFTLEDEPYFDQLDQDPNFATGSVFALQARSDLGDGLETVVQIKAQGVDDWESDFEWAYVGYQASDSLKFIIGRQVNPYYMFSDHVDVGYAYHWVRTPDLIYSLPFTSIDGIGLLWQSELFAFDSTIQLVFGRSDTELETQLGDRGAVTLEVDAKNETTLNWTLEYEWLKLRFGYSQSKLDIPLEDVQLLADAWSQTAAGLRLANPAFAPIADQMEKVGGSLVYEESRIRNYAFGLVLDFDRVQLFAEVTELDASEGFLGTSEYEYVSLVLHATDSFAVHATGGRLENIFTDQKEQLQRIPMDLTGGAAPPLDAGINALLAGTQELYDSQKRDDEFQSYGLRWDFHHSAALKLEYIQFDSDFAGADTSILRSAISFVF